MENGSFKESALALAICLAVVASAVALVVTGNAPESSVVPSERVQAAAAPPATPRPVEPIPVARQPSPECPEMDNPGGRLEWVPDEDPGPIPTNGTVALPTLGVEAPIVKVGIDEQSMMVVPTNARDVAWLDQGGIPGFTQNVVLAGHINYSGASGSFGRIAELQPGDEITVKIEDKDLRYRVQWNCSFPRDTDRAEQIMGYTNAPSITLISCGGVFDRAARTHTNRIAVRAELVTDA